MSGRRISLQYVVSYTRNQVESDVVGVFSVATKYVIPSMPCCITRNARFPLLHVLASSCMMIVLQPKTPKNTIYEQMVDTINVSIS